MIRKALSCLLCIALASGSEVLWAQAGADPEVAKGMVFFSGGAFTDAAREFLRRVPNPQIEKPFDPQQLRELIRRLLHS